MAIGAEVNNSIWNSNKYKLVSKCGQVGIGAKMRANYHCFVAKANVNSVTSSHLRYGQLNTLRI